MFIHTAKKNQDAVTAGTVKPFHSDPYEETYQRGWLFSIEKARLSLLFSLNRRNSS